MDYWSNVGAFAGIAALFVAILAFMISQRDKGTEAIEDVRRGLSDFRSDIRSELSVMQFQMKNVWAMVMPTALSKQIDAGALEHASPYRRSQKYATEIMARDFRTSATLNRMVSDWPELPNENEIAFHIAGTVHPDTLGQLTAMVRSEYKDKFGGRFDTDQFMAMLVGWCSEEWMRQNKGEPPGGP